MNHNVIFSPGASGWIWTSVCTCSEGCVVPDHFDHEKHNYHDKCEKNNDNFDHEKHNDHDKHETHYDHDKHDKHNDHDNRDKHNDNHNDHDDDEFVDERTHCQEGGGEGQGAGSKNLKKEKFDPFFKMWWSEEIFLISRIILSCRYIWHENDSGWSQ